MRKNHLLQKLHHLISTRKTGTPAELSAKLLISKRQVFRYLEDLIIMGAAITYCRKTKTYFYKNDFYVHIYIGKNPPPRNSILNH